MFKLLLTLLFSYLLLFQVICIAKEAQEIPQEQISQPEEDSDSEAQKEADEAEAAELREAGVGEEPTIE